MIFGAWVGLIAAVGTVSVIAFEIARTIARVSRSLSIALGAGSAALLTWFVMAGIQLPSGTQDWETPPRMVPAVLLGAAMVGFVAGQFTRQHPERPAVKAPEVKAPAEPVRQGTTLRAEIAGNPAAAVDGDLYMHRAHGLALRGIDSWLVQPFEPRFRDAGGFLAVESPDGGVRINLLAGPLDLRFFSSRAGTSLFEQWKAKEGATLEDLRQQTRGRPVRQLDLPELDGERRVARFEFDTANGRMGKVCALHADREYVAYYTSTNTSKFDVDQVIRSWRWLATDDVALERAVRR